jgi:transcription elongation factor Elf1
MVIERRVPRPPDKTPTYIECPSCHRAVAVMAEQDRRWRKRFFFCTNCLHGWVAYLDENRSPEPKTGHSSDVDATEKAGGIASLRLDVEQHPPGTRYAPQKATDAK